MEQNDEILPEVLRNLPEKIAFQVLTNILVKNTP